MALTATIFRFEFNLSDVDRGVYETLELRVAQHPSETDAYLVTRLLAMAMEYRDDLSFGRGVCVPEDPALSAPNEMGGVSLWIDIGHPSPDRLHKVTKQADEVCVYTHKSPEPIVSALRSGDVYGAERVTVVAFPPAFIDEVAARLERNNRWDILCNQSVVYVTIDDETFQCAPVISRGRNREAI